LRVFDDCLMIFDDLLMIRWWLSDFCWDANKEFSRMNFWAKKSGHIHIRWIDMNIQKLNWEIVKSRMEMRRFSGSIR
jgi:hypothetical protein